MWMATTMLPMVSNGMFCLDTSILHGMLVGSGLLLFVTLVKVVETGVEGMG